MSNEAALVLALLITAAEYLFVPIIFCLRDKKLTLPQINKITVANLICVFLIDSVIAIEMGGKSAPLAAVIWSAIAYWLMKRKCLKKEDNAVQEQNTKQELEPIQPNNDQVRICVSPIDKTPKRYGNYNVYGKDVAIEKNEVQLPQSNAEYLMCPACSTVLPIGSKYCHNCQSQIESATMFCHNCGAKLPPNSNFCNKCGTKMQP